MEKKTNKNPSILRIESVEFCNGRPCVLCVNITDKVTGCAKNFIVEKNRNTNELEFGITTVIGSAVHLITESEIFVLKKVFSLAIKNGDFSNMEF